MRVDTALLVRYHKGECSAEEKALVEAWLDSGADIIGYEDKVPGEELLPEEWELPRQKRLFSKKLLYVSSVAALLCCVLGGLWYYGTQADTDQLADHTAAQQLFKTERGKMLRLTLVDGTQVVLNAESELLVPKSFTDSNRVVSIRGEAHFTVAKDPNRPFYVMGENGKVRVLGTVFNFRSYPAEKTELVVEEGKVAFSTLAEDQHAVILTKGMRAVLDPLAKRIVQDDRKQKTSGLWREGGLNIDDLTILEIGKIIERRFDVKVVITDRRIAHQRYSGTYTSLSLRQLVDDIAFVIGCKTRVSSEQVEFY